jgi:hypothetical protein
MPADPHQSALRDHQAWLGYLQPDGLVVSPAALADQQVVLDRGQFIDLQERFEPFVSEVPLGDEIKAQAITNVPAFLTGFLDWPSDLVYGFSEDQPLPDQLCIPLRDFGETLTPSFAFRDPQGSTDHPWLILGQVLPAGTDLDARPGDSGHGWNASPSQKFERLLRETRVPIGLIITGTQIRLVYAPRGENTGSLTFPIAAMTEIAGRPILSAFHLLLDSYRLIAAATAERLPALLQRSRDYQGHISEELAGQVLEALYELLRGFQAANERTKGDLLRQILRDNPDAVYNALLTVLLRLVFILFAEDRGLMPGSSLYVRNYSLHGLFERLRADAEQNPDTMDSRFGAWSQLLALFRAIHDGCRHPQLKMPARRGHLFDPHRFPFLEGRSSATKEADIKSQIPLVSDGTLFRVLSKLLLLQGERLSYRTLDVEHIGGVYQQMMDFRLLVTSGPSIAIKPKKSSGAPAIINLDALLAIKPADRAKWLTEQTDQKLTGEPEKALKAATKLDDLLAALEKKMDRRATPHLVPAGAIVLQPSDERRKSGSHYTPRQLTEPIVRKTLEPILRRLVSQSTSSSAASAIGTLVPTQQQILDLKICDLAMGSAAFLVETCRQLADVLVASWHAHKNLPPIPPDEDEEKHAMRLIAQRCLYGVDRNPMAVDLAKLSLWLATLARDHPFTFLDHSLRSGDALVGLTRRQIEDFHWLPENNRAFGQDYLEFRIKTATGLRREILEGGDILTPARKAEKLAQADEALDFVRRAGDLVIAAFFAEEKPKARIAKRDELLNLFRDGFLTQGALDKSDPEALRKSFEAAQQCKAIQAGLHHPKTAVPVRPFHWHIEFPEVFAREQPGFDAIVGNPPFMGGKRISTASGDSYRDWLPEIHEQTNSSADLVAHFFRRGFNLLRLNGSMGLIATNTIGQGDTRSTGLRWICTHGGTIYCAIRRYKWPGQAAVVVSVVWIAKSNLTGPLELDGRVVPIITAYLFHAGGHEDPFRLLANQDTSYIGTIALGMGFTFDDTDNSGETSSLATMQQIIETDPSTASLIQPYLGGEEFNNNPEQRPHRYIINFGDMSESEARQFPSLIQIVEEKVKPYRDGLKRDVYRKRWWQFGEKQAALYSEASGLSRVLTVCRVSQSCAFGFARTGAVFADSLVVICKDTCSSFALLQSRPHELWTRFFASSMKDDLRYTPSDCFETFSFPLNWESNADLEEAGHAYHEYRAALMVRNNEGLTKTYNRFHDPEETSPDIAKLRELHAAMDAAVITAYGWADLIPQLRCEFLLDYEDEEDPESTETSTKRRRKKPWRYRWPDDLRDEVLARLLKLNAERAEQERLAGELASQGTKRKRTKATEDNFTLES